MKMLCWLIAAWRMGDEAALEAATLLAAFAAILNAGPVDRPHGGGVPVGH